MFRKYNCSIISMQPISCLLILVNINIGFITRFILQAASFGGTNIDPTAWEDKKCKGESRFPAQVS